MGARRSAARGKQRNHEVVAPLHDMPLEIDERHEQRHEKHQVVQRVPLPHALVRPGAKRVVPRGRQGGSPTRPPLVPGRPLIGAVNLSLSLSLLLSLSSSFLLPPCSTPNTAAAASASTSATPQPAPPPAPSLPATRHHPSAMPSLRRSRTSAAAPASRHQQAAKAAINGELPVPPLPLPSRPIKGPSSSSPPPPYHHHRAPPAIVDRPPRATSHPHDFLYLPHFTPLLISARAELPMSSSAAAHGPLLPHRNPRRNLPKWNPLVVLSLFPSLPAPLPSSLAGAPTPWLPPPSYALCGWRKKKRAIVRRAKELAAAPLRRAVIPPTVRPLYSGQTPCDSPVKKPTNAHLGGTPSGPARMPPHAMETKEEQHMRLEKWGKGIKDHVATEEEPVEEFGGEYREPKPEDPYHEQEFPEGFDDGKFNLTL
ncbi:hypothetical protein HU200_066889 [Digitaria exilis]|uniref:Uncharacterized protein n=1 Tax=Digitaria exilis TaxID=1010633 RepID=A0A835A0C9_9POAL|nr:hypothetical protein HU200_066889 [Digitaria exilis]